MSRPDIREIESFVAVADHLNFTRAARQLHLSQPPLTRHIQALEEKLNCRLLDRNTHAVSLTPAGQIFLEDARALLAHLDRAGEALRRVQRGETWRLRLAFVGALLDARLVHLVQRFRRDHPQCQVDLSDLPPAEQMKEIEAGRLDGGFIGAQPARAPKGIGLVLWGHEPLVLAVPGGHELARGKIRGWAQLRDVPWVMVSRSAAPAFRQQFAEWARRHGLAGRIVQESERVPAVLTMVAAGNGISMVPQSATHLVPEGICFRDLPEPRLRLRQVFAYREKIDRPGLGEFLALFKSARPGALLRNN
jgi:DNA-binding transcriptional LysR family regulator